MISGIMHFTKVGAQFRKRFLLCLQGSREKREDQMPMLWELIRGTIAAREKWARVH